MIEPKDNFILPRTSELKPLSGLNPLNPIKGQRGSGLAPLTKDLPGLVSSESDAKQKAKDILNINKEYEKEKKNKEEQVIIDEKRKEQAEKDRAE